MLTVLRTPRSRSFALGLIAWLLVAVTSLFAARTEGAESPSGSVWGSPPGGDPCASEHLLEGRLAEDAALRERRDLFERLVREAERRGIIPSADSRRNATTSSTYVIPVAVHIVATFPSAAEDISDNQVLSQIYALNRDFANSPGSPSPAVDAGISFCLAQGLPTNSTVTWSTTPGITRDYSTQTNHVYGNPSSETALKAISYLPSNQYLNIWVVKHISGYTGGVIGYATFPGAGPPSLDGVVMRASAFGSNNTPHGGPWSLLPSNDDGKILTHEVGHYLNLFHTFHGGCAPPGDQVSDTPPEQVNRSNCPSPAPTSCTAAFDPIENFMDYTNDACRFAFTAGQSVRMQAAINQYRSLLVSGASLVQAGCSAGLNALIDAAPTQLCAGGTVQFTTPASGAGWTYSWSFPGGTPSSASTQSVAVTYPGSGAWQATLTVTDGGSNSNTNFRTIYVSNCTPILNACTHWTYGSHSAVSFATGVPVAFAGPLHASTEAAATMSSATGALLFYSDGDRVLNASHAVMSNGTGIFAGGSSHNGVIAVRRPGSSSQYYLFQVRMQEFYPTTNLISYSVIDMTLNSGLGDIPAGQKNLPITLPGNPDGMLEALALIPHCNGTDWWLISEGATGSVAKVFVTPITSAGPGVSTAYPPTGGHGLNPGAIVPSADGTKFVTVAIASADIAIYKFNRATGAVTVDMPSTVLSAYTDAVLSPNKQLLYYNYKIGSVYGVRQLELATLQWREIFNNNYTAIKLGPDGKIYIAEALAPALHCINYPDVFNANDQNECGLNLYAIPYPYPTINSIWGALPNMVQACTGAIPPAQFSYQVTNCTTVQFQSANCAGPYTWNFGDNTSGSGQSVTHVYAGPGTYTVTLTVPGANPPVATQSVTIGMQPVTIAGSNTACDTLGSYSVVGPAGYTYQWSISGGIPTFASGNSVEVDWLTTGGTLTLTATDPATGCVTNVTKNVGPCPTCTKPPLGMCAWWPLDEPAGTTAIETVLGNHGTDVSLPAHVPGQVRRGRQFNGASSHVQVNDAVAINFGTGDLTIDAWIRTTAATGVRSIVDKRFADPEVGYAMYLRNGRLAFRLAGQSSSSGTEYWTAATPFLADGQWHHVAAVEQRSDAATGTRLYADGNLVASFPAYNASANITNAEKLLIGAGASTLGPATFFDGVIDEVELFQRALTDADILALVYADSLGKCKEFGYVPALASFCRDQNDRTLTMQVCNHTSAPQTYNLAFTGLPTGGNCTWPGPTNIQVLGPNPVTVPPNSCVPVSYQVFRPAGMPLYSTTCYQATMTNNATSYSTVVQGSITAARQWCFLPITPVRSWGSVGSGTTLRFVLTNSSDVPLDTPYMARVIPMESWAGEASGIALNGMAPGFPFIGIAAAGPGDSAVIEISTQFTEERPFRAYNIAVTLDESNDGAEDAAAAVVLRYAPDAVALASVPQSPAAIGGGWISVAPNPSRDLIRIRYALAEPGEVEIGLYDIAGRRVRTILKAYREAGPGSVAADGRALPRGVYLVRMRTSRAVATQRIVMIR